MCMSESQPQILTFRELSDDEISYIESFIDSEPHFNSHHKEYLLDTIPGLIEQYPTTIKFSEYDRYREEFIQRVLDTNKIRNEYPYAPLVKEVARKTFNELIERTDD